MFAESISLAAPISLAPPLKAANQIQPAPTCPGPQGLAGETVVRTIFGLRAVSRLVGGDVLLDTHNRMVELRSIRKYRARPSEVVRVEPSAFGLGLAPGRLDRALVVGGGQKLGVCDWRTEILFSAPALSPAARLVDGVNLHRADCPVTLFQLAFDDDTIITADGITTMIGGSDA